MVPFGLECVKQGSSFDGGFKHFSEGVAESTTSIMSEDVGVLMQEDGEGARIRRERVGRR